MGQRGVNQNNRTRSDASSPKNRNPRKNLRLAPEQLSWQEDPIKDCRRDCGVDCADECGCIWGTTRPHTKR